ncbi:MAG: cobalamin biosynthesis protein P47K, partial [Pirellulales bacterium]|nr:cobalamin biosynthesis protein P47K [Pirellulales bacterium]
KTTTLARLATHYIQRGNRVGLVTNDQAYGLVDTASLRAQGFHVGEVPGACFCCKFDDLVDTVAQLSADERPDVIIVEPVGSCTDLVATVIEPLRHFHGDRYRIAPMVTLVKPEHGLKILRDGSGFSPKAAYIFLKQIEEADVAAINKIDKLSNSDREELKDLVAARFPDLKLMALSALSGEGFDELVEVLDADRRDVVRTMDVDYDTYAEGEAELGWLNCAVTVAAEENNAFNLDELVLDVLRRISSRLHDSNDEPAHIKIMAQSGPDFAIGNLVDSDSTGELSVASGIETSGAELLINARVAGDPEQLAAVARDELLAAVKARQLNAVMGEQQHFRPARPVPTHRMQS